MNGTPWPPRSDKEIQYSTAVLLPGREYYVRMCQMCGDAPAQHWGKWSKTCCDACNRLDDREAKPLSENVYRVQIAPPGCSIWDNKKGRPDDSQPLAVVYRLSRFGVWLEGAGYDAEVLHAVRKPRVADPRKDADARQLLALMEDT